MDASSLTKFERVKVIAMRAEMLAAGAPSWLEHGLPPGQWHALRGRPAAMAELELGRGLVPLSLLRGEGAAAQRIDLFTGVDLAAGQIRAGA